MYSNLIIASLIVFLTLSFILLSKTRRMSNMYGLLLNNSKDYIIFLYRYGRKKRFIYISQSSEVITGYSPEEYYKDPGLFEKLVYPEDIPVFEYQRDFSAMSNRPIVMRWVRRDGHVIWTEHRYNKIVNNKGNIIAVEGIIKDITEQKVTEFALIGSERKFRELFNNANDMIFLCEYTGSVKIIEVNESVINQLNFSRSRLLSMHILDLVDGGSLNSMRRILDEMTLNKSINTEMSFINSERKGILVDLSIRYFKIDGRDHILIIARDISVKRKYDNEIQKTQRLESLGILAGGIAHDFNNYLTGILGNISLVMINMKDEDANYPFLTEAARASYKAKDLSGQLLTFAKGGVPVKKTGDIGKLINDSVKFITSGSNVKCELTIDEGLWLTSYDEIQLTQVFDNIVINAMQAMPKGGNISIYTRNIEIFDNYQNIKDGKYIKITIDDNGPGIDSEYLDKIFDPFFTTKSTGTGLGLATTYSIIKKHEGYIFVNSKKGLGASFIIFIPVIECEANNTFDDFSLNNSILKKNLLEINNLNVLVMDDDEIILDIEKKLLEKLGYTVECVKNGEDALSTYKAHLEKGLRFDILLLDLTIKGGMGGIDTIRELKAIDFSVKAILTSGYSNDPIFDEYRKYGFSDILVKPYTIDQLKKVLERSLIVH